jgi:hypothetical protein
MASNSEWGPPLWRILHTLAERVGGQQNKILSDDEERRWSQVLVGAEASMPCKLCRRHYKERRKGLSLAGVHGPHLRDVSRQWLWTLHEEVNKERGIVSGVALDQLPALYGARRAADVDADLAALAAALQKAMMVGLVGGEAVRSWRTALAHLRALAGV